ncbi:MAG: RNA polymerase sigma factor [Nitrospiraceae bacterium]
MSSVDLAQLFHCYAQDVRRFLVSRVACDATAADLTQETFLRLAQLPDLGAIENCRTYLFRIATNLAIDHIRALSRRRPAIQEHDEYLLAHPDRASTPEAALLAKEELARVLHALHEMSPLCRQIFALNRFDGLPHRDIADRLGICVSTVEKNLARALNHCRRRLNESVE